MPDVYMFVILHRSYCNLRFLSMPKNAQPRSEKCTLKKILFYIDSPPPNTLAIFLKGLNW
jgi:hypothetical protein